MSALARTSRETHAHLGTRMHRVSVQMLAKCLASCQNIRDHSLASPKHVLLITNAKINNLDLHFTYKEYFKKKQMFVVPTIKKRSFLDQYDYQMNMVLENAPFVGTNVKERNIS
jgi:hypothetical protein